MQIVKTIKEIKENNEPVEAGVYLTSDNDYMWLTFSRSGTCKKLTTAMRKAGLK